MWPPKEAGRTQTVLDKPEAALRVFFRRRCQVREMSNWNKRNPGYSVTENSAILLHMVM